MLTRLRFSLAQSLVYPGIFLLGSVLTVGWALKTNRDLLTVTAPIVAMLAGLTGFLYSRHSAQLTLFRELFREFNSRYDKLNDPLNEILKREPGQKLTSDDAKILFDYFNLCAEEYMYFHAGFIDARIWKAWTKGMLQFAKDPEIRVLWHEEIASESYYGFELSLVGLEKSSNK